MSIPLHLVTGFLGSGKSSFLNHFINIYGSTRRIAIIQNEFSSANVDKLALKNDFRYEILEVNNGSAFCVCLLGSFINSLAGFVDKHSPELLIMEASGLSDPIGVGQIFQSEKLKSRVYLGHVWCLVDALNFNKTPALKLRLYHQLRVADTIIINKTDLAVDNILNITSQVKKINPSASLLYAKYGEVEFTELKKSFNVFPLEEPLARPDLESVVIRNSIDVSPDSLLKFIEKIKPFCLRCKGFVKIKGGKTLFVQGVFSDYSYDEVSGFPESGELILIGNFKDLPNMQVLFDEYCKI